MKFKLKINIKGNKIIAAACSAFIAIFFLSLTYIYWNMPYTGGFGDQFILSMSMFRNLAIDRDFDDSNIVPVNVAYDKMLIPHYDPRDSTVAGVRAITDREKLLTFLKMLKARDKYDYIFCDVRLDKYETEYDEELFSTIASMRDIVVASSDTNDAPEQIKDKVALSFYSAGVVGDDFMKYNYILDDGKPNMALKIWQDITGGTLSKKGLSYFINKKRCVRSVIPDFRYSIYDDIKEASDRTSTTSNAYSSKIYNLGAQVVEPYKEGYISGKFFDGKFIMIGDFTENDIHSTIAGEQPGPIITYNAYLSLLHKDNIIPHWIYLLLFVVLWLESMFLLKDRFGITFKIHESRLFRIFKRKNPKKAIEKETAKEETAEEETAEEETSEEDARIQQARHSDRRIRHYIKLLFIEYLSYSTPLIILAIIIYAISGVFINALILGSLFTFLSIFV